MTVYNREAFLAEAIESVLASALQDLELIVADDDSKDRSFEIAQSFAAKDARIRTFRNDRNLGDYPNRNRAASFARGTYVKYLDSDDLIYPWGLAVMVDCMTRFPEAGLGLSAVAEAHCPHPRLLSPREAYLEHFTRKDLLGRAPGSAIIRREAFESLGGFTGLRQVGDFELWLKMVARYPLVTMPRDLVWDRTHGQQEQLADDEIEKLGMRNKVAVAALEADVCPLTERERAEARLSMTRAYRKEFWLRLLVQQQPSAAFRLRRTVGLSLTKLAT
jgi:glycosyltransferase involved in cell wall biosynthesis